jgi:hypothetical protein
MHHQEEAEAGGDVKATETGPPATAATAATAIGATTASRNATAAVALRLSNVRADGSHGWLPTTTCRHCCYCCYCSRLSIVKVRTASAGALDRLSNEAVEVDQLGRQVP